MTMFRTAPLMILAFLIGSSAGAVAQAPPGIGGQQPPCMNDFIPLRQDVEKRAGAIKAAMERKAPAQEACKLFQSFAAAEAKLLKFSEANATWCGIPAQAVTQMKTGHAHTLKARTQVCSAGANAPKPAVPRLSDALGTSNAPVPQPVSPNRGTFDTLTGNALSR